MKSGASEDYSSGDMTQVLGMSTDGLRGLSPLSLFRNSLQTSEAGEVAANRTFTSGSLISGLVTTEEDVTAERPSRSRRTSTPRSRGRRTPATSRSSTGR